MQKLAKRAAQAQRQAVRRAARIAEETRKTEQNRARRYLKEANAEIRSNIHEARRARKEDWELGPLAPKRDLGFNGYGEISTGRRDWSQGGQFKINPELAAKRCAWAGGVKQFCLAPGDRVVIMDGQEKGKIDRIKSVQPEDGLVLLEKLNRVSEAGSSPLDNRKLTRTGH
jgi:large subunit ribosomal protein L24